MPLYVYQVIEPDGSEGEIFELLQGMNEPALTQHPESGKPVQRILHMPNTTRRYGAANLDPTSLARKGFTQYKKAGDGFYEKTAGSGPDVISGNG